MDDDNDFDGYEDQEVEDEAEIAARLKREIEQIDEELRRKEAEKMDSASRAVEQGFFHILRLLEKRIKNAEPIFSSEIWKRKSLEKCLGRYFEYFLIAAARGKRKLKPEEFPKLCEAYTRIETLNEEITSKLGKASGLPEKCIEVIKTKHMKAHFTRMQFHSYRDNSFETPDVSEKCLGVGCCVGYNDNGEAYYRYLFLNGNGYDHKLKPVPVDEEDKPTIFCFCYAHMDIAYILFTFFHMKWNIYMNAKYRIEQEREKQDFHNADEAAAKVPDSVKQALVLEYMSRYYKVLIFGRPNEIAQWGRTMFVRIGSSKVSTKDHFAKIDDFDKEKEDNEEEYEDVGDADGIAETYDINDI